MARFFHLIFLFFISIRLTYTDPHGGVSSSSSTEDDEKIQYKFVDNSNQLEQLVRFYENGVKIFIFNAKQGNFCLIKNQQNAIVVDAGSGNNFVVDKIEFPAIQKTFATCLGTAKIQAVIITHADEDHYNLLSALENYMDPSCFFVVGGTEAHRNAILSTLGVDYESYWLDTSSSDLIFKGSNPGLEGSGIEWERVPVEYEYVEERLNDLIPNSSFQFLQPVIPLLQGALISKDGQQIFNTNDYSLVFKFTYGGNSILFTGDATKNTYDVYFPHVIEQDVEIKKGLKTKNEVILGHVNLYMIPHHGSIQTSLCWTNMISSLNKTNLVGSVFNVGINSDYGHPDPEWYKYPWPKPMRSLEKRRVVGHWKIKKNIKEKKAKKERVYKRVAKKIHFRIIETGLSKVGVVAFSFTPNGCVHFTNDSLMWECIIQNNIPRIFAPTISKLVNLQPLNRQDYLNFDELPSEINVQKWLYSSLRRANQDTRLIREKYFPKFKVPLNYKKIQKSKRVISIQYSLPKELGEAKKFLQQSIEKQNQNRLDGVVITEDGLQLQEIAIPADGNCGYTALGFTREQARELLLKNLSDPFVRMYIQNEMRFLAQTHAIPDFLTNSIENFIYYYISSSTLEFSKKFSDFPLNYMNFGSDSYFAADAIAYIQRYNIVVYNRKSRILHRTNFNFQETRYLILTGEHFNRGVRI